ncbi:DUF5068 domain-containing protein [Priestia aryabhattai]|uniref:DUF5068 domain-containing protein n=1 Tax=Priestia aryabhattai TaxID=412384 RepID=UPI0032E92A63
MKKKLILAGILASSLTVATACGNSDTASSNDDSKEKTESTQSQSKEDKATENNSSDKKTSSKEDSNSQISDTGVMNKEITKTLESAKAEAVYDNKEPNISSDQKGFKFNVDRYQVVHVTNVDDENIFDGAKEGYIVTVKATVNNQSNGKAYFNIPDLQGKDMFDTHLNRRATVYESLLEPKTEGTVDEPSYYKKGEKQTGLFEFYLTKEEYEGLKNAHTKMVIPYASSNKDMTKHLGEEETLDMPLSKVDKEEQAKNDEKEAQEAPYKDNILDNNVAEKEVLSKKATLNLTQKSEKVDVTVEGVEYSKLNPTESYKNEFTSFDGEDVVAASVKLKVKNNTDSDITLRQFSVFLQNDNVKFLDQGTLGSHAGTVSPGQEGEKYVVFLMKRKSDFEATNNFTFRITHITNSDGKDLLSKELDFNLPTK